MRKHGILKDYLKAELVVAIQIDVADPPYQFCLVLHRVPSRRQYFQAVDRNCGNARESSHCDVPINTQSNCVFFVRQSCERANNVVAANVPIRSRIWLMGSECVPEPLINPSFLDESFKVNWRLGPRVVDTPVAPFASQISSGERRLIKGISGVDEGFGGLSGHALRQPFVQDQLLNILSGITVNLSNNAADVILKESLAGLFKLRNCVLCPTDRIARWRKLSEDFEHSTTLFAE
jgi:hypothetical protein